MKTSHHITKPLLTVRIGQMGVPDGSAVENLPAVQEPQAWALTWDDPLEEEMATHSSSLTWETPWIEEPGKLQSMES